MLLSGLWLAILLAGSVCVFQAAAAERPGRVKLEGVSVVSTAVTQKFYGKSVSISSVKSASPNTMEIRWKARAKATGYVIYRSPARKSAFTVCKVRAVMI